MKIDAPIEITQESLRKSVVDTLIDEGWTIDDISEEMVVEAVLSNVLNFCSYCDAEKLAKCLSLSERYQIADAYATAVGEFIREMICQKRETSTESEG